MEITNTRVELPADAYQADTSKHIFPLRGNNLNTEGSLTRVVVNQYRMKSFNFDKKIYQYDVTISPNLEKKSVVLKKLWAHPTTRDFLSKFNYTSWIFDGRQLAWSSTMLEGGQVKFMVDLDENKGDSRGRSRAGGQFYIMIRFTTEINMAALHGYLENRCSFDTATMEAMNFADHVLRQYPSQTMLAIKRNFFSLESKRERMPIAIGPCIEVHKGIYASIRLSNNLALGGIGLALNIDVANTCFWTGSQTMDTVICNFLASCNGYRWGSLDPVAASQNLRPVEYGSGQWGSSDAFKQLRKLRRLKFKIRHANRPPSNKVYTIDGFTFDERYGAQGATAKTMTFEYEGKQTSVEEYYRRRYKVQLKYSQLPLIDAGKGGYIPAELAVLEPMQRYRLKLNPEQTSALIKIAASRPLERRANIEKSALELGLDKDPYLKEYGISFESKLAETEARILPPPKVQFGQGCTPADPRFSGRWDTRGKKFALPNRVPLQNWAFVVMDSCVDGPQLQAFAKRFRQVFLGHGGRCLSDAILLQVPQNRLRNVAQAIEWAHHVVTRERGYTQLLFVVVRSKNSPHYERLKKSADCRFGILSQVVTGEAVKRNNDQYISNVCLKVNSKLGGAISFTTAPWKSEKSYFPKERPTMVVGVDVSHGSPGSDSASIAAMTMSIDGNATRYAALVQTNGRREECLTQNNVHFLFSQLAQQWKAGHGGAFPKHVIYFRDGVSETEFKQVLDKEVAEVKKWLSATAPKLPMPKFTVVVVTKMHHIRFFPAKGDKNGNPLPGTLVEKEVTHPFMWDFYLCSHVAIQGTARPVHYHVILDEMKVPVNDFQKMIYHQCYSYARSTTPVSIHPAIYYAHLAASRARAHENLAAESPEVAPLLPLGGRPEGGADDAVEGEMRQRNFFRGTMWYI